MPGSSWLRDPRVLFPWIWTSILPSTHLWVSISPGPVQSSNLLIFTNPICSHLGGNAFLMPWSTQSNWHLTVHFSSLNIFFFFSFLLHPFFLSNSLYDIVANINPFFDNWVGKAQNKLFNLVQVLENEEAKFRNIPVRWNRDRAQMGGRVIELQWRWRGMVGKKVGFGKTLTRQWHIRKFSWAVREVLRSPVNSVPYFQAMSLPCYLCCAWSLSGISQWKQRGSRYQKVASIAGRSKRHILMTRQNCKIYRENIFYHWK